MRQNNPWLLANAAPPGNTYAKKKIAQMETKAVVRAESKSVVLAMSFWNLEPELVGLSLSVHVLSPLLERRIKSFIHVTTPLPVHFRFF